MSRRAPTPLRSTPSSAPYESMAASQQAHISDLVQKNTTLEHIIMKLKDELAREDTRSKDAVKAIQAQWHEERKEWAQSCDLLQDYYRIAHLRTIKDLEQERVNVCLENDTTRWQRLARLQRDYKIVLFQAKETQLEVRISELEDELEEIIASSEMGNKSLEGQYREQMNQLKRQYAELAADIKQRTKELAVMKDERDELQEDLTKLLKQQAVLNSTVESTKAELERTTLRSDGFQSTNADLERQNDDLKRTNNDLKRQLDKWQDLETKGGAEVENLRRARIELEVEVKKLQNRLNEAERRDEEQNAVIEKEQKRVEKLKAAYQQAQERADTAEENAVLRESELSEANARAAKAEKQAAKLKAQLEAGRGAAQHVSPEQKKSPLKVAEDDNEEGSSEDEVEIEVAKSSTSGREAIRPKSKPKVRKQEPGDNDEADGVDEVAQVPLPEKPRPRLKNRNQDVSKDDETERVGDNKMAAAPSAKSLGKRKAAAGDGNNVGAVGANAKKGRKVGENGDGPKKGKGRARLESDEEGAAASTSRIKNKPRESAAAKAKRSRIISVQAADDNEEKGTPPKKKKRKINSVFPTANPTSFNWGQLDQTESALKIDIPTRLASPEKETQPHHSSLGSIFSFSGRR